MKSRLIIKREVLGLQFFIERDSERTMVFVGKRGYWFGNPDDQTRHTIGFFMTENWSKISRDVFYQKRADRLANQFRVSELIPELKQHEGVSYY